ncbi:acyltransferase family protein [Lactococcus lactis]|uniref:acyltransferase family protein n=1 Tax=Lactococcus lactis TaxID=1358 RepID=UPI001D1916C2|nr:acyltransferase family protein [Lactococcus lactis]MCC4121469.1 acetyltransferase [Lactococcus lactis]
MQKKKIYLPEIDFFRGFAVLIVILYHIPQTFLPGGLQGVTIFFVISGFLMTKNSIREGNNFKIGRFYFKRIKRIYPFLIFTLLIFLLIFGILNPRLIGNIRSELPSLIFGYNNWWQLNNGVSYFDSYLNSSLFKHYWSLAVELQFYVLWPFIFLLSNKWSKRPFLYVIGLLICVSILTSMILPSTTAYYHTIARLFPFLFGILGYLYKDKIVKFFRKKAFLKGWILFLIVILLVLCPMSSFTLTELVISAIVAILLVSMDDPYIAKKMRFKRTNLHLVGKISYELYLVHFPIFIALANLFKTNRFSIFSLLYFPMAYICTELLIGGFKIWRKNMCSKFLWFLIPLVVIAACCVLVLHAPDNRLTHDQKNLKKLLAKNETAAQERSKSKNTEQSQTSETLFIGDSVMLGGYQEIENVFKGSATVDAKESRQVTALPDILSSCKGLDKYNKVVIGLGTNGVITEAAIDAAMKLLKDKQVYWINIKVPRDWESTVNGTLQRLVGKYPNLKIIDWHSKSQNHPEYFYDDEIHLNETGRAAYANFLHSSVK